MEPSALPTPKSSAPGREVDLRAAAHAISNPLCAILGLVELLLADAEPGTKTHERLSVIEQSAREIRGLVHDFAAAAVPPDPAEAAS